MKVEALTRLSLVCSEQKLQKVFKKKKRNKNQLLKLLENLIASIKQAVVSAIRITLQRK